MQGGIRWAVGEIGDVVLSGSGKLVHGMKAGNLNLPLQIQRRQTTIGHIQKIVVVKKILQHVRHDQQSSVPNLRVSLRQGFQFHQQIGRQLFNDFSLTDSAMNLPMHMHRLGKWTQIQTNDRPL